MSLSLQSTLSAMQKELHEVYEEIDNCEDDALLAELKERRDELKEEIELVKDELHSIHSNY